MNKNTNYTGRDLGNGPALINFPQVAMANTYYRSAIWTGKYLQVTLMSIVPGGEIGLEMHNDVDQLIRVEKGTAKVFMGTCEENVKLVGVAPVGCAILVPAGTWHNVVNATKTPLKLSSVYAPIQHPFGTIHQTKADSDAAHH